jgi:hypothetical protein
MSLALLVPSRRSFDAARAEWRRDRAERRVLRVTAREAAARCECTGCRIDRGR